MNKKASPVDIDVSERRQYPRATNVAELKGNVPEEKATASVAPEEQTSQRREERRQRASEKSTTNQ